MAGCPGFMGHKAGRRGRGAVGAVGGGRSRRSRMCEGEWPRKAGQTEDIQLSDTLSIPALKCQQKCGSVLNNRSQGAGRPEEKPVFLCTKASVPVVSTSGL